MPAGAADLVLPVRRRSAPSGGSEPHEVGRVGAYKVMAHQAMEYPVRTGLKLM